MTADELAALRSRHAVSPQSPATLSDVLAVYEAVMAGERPKLLPQVQALTAERDALAAEVKTIAKRTEAATVEAMVRYADANGPLFSDELRSGAWKESK